MSKRSRHNTLICGEARRARVTCRAATDRLCAYPSEAGAVRDTGHRTPRYSLLRSSVEAETGDKALAVTSQSCSIHLVRRQTRCPETGRRKYCYCLHAFTRQCVPSCMCTYFELGRAWRTRLCRHSQAVTKSPQATRVERHPCPISRLFLHSKKQIKESLPLQDATPHFAPTSTDSALHRPHIIQHGWPTLIPST